MNIFALKFKLRNKSETPKTYILTIIQLSQDLRNVFYIIIALQIF